MWCHDNSARQFQEVVELSFTLKDRVRRVLSSLSTKPGYTLMRAFARFSVLRFLVPYVRGWVLGSTAMKNKEMRKDSEHPTLFPDVNVDKVVSDLREGGVAFGLKLSDEVVSAIRTYADRGICYADRDPVSGFSVGNREQAEKAIGKKILVAQYFNTTTECPEIARLANDPVLYQIAERYLDSAPTFVGANLWWTFPVDASKEDRDRHAHLFHRDVDDFRFFKFFFYLTDVEAGDGAHICVIGSQGKPPTRHPLDRWNIRRYTDQEIEQQYASQQIKEICGQAGDGFAEDTWCIHKGQTPVIKPRLLLQLQFALFDYGAMHDRRDHQQLRNVA